MAREWALAGVTEEELKPTPHLEPPKTPKGKWQNFWYHYKWATLIIAFFVLVGGILTWQLLTRDAPDYRLVLVTDTLVPDSVCDYIGELLTPYAEDRDGDGKIEIRVEDLYLTGSDTAAVSTNASTMTAYMASGDVVLFGVTPQYYRERIVPILSDGFEFFDTLDVTDPGITADGRLWNWKGSALQKNAVLSEMLPEDLCFGVRIVAGMASLNRDAPQEAAAAKALLTRLITSPLPLS